MIEISEISEISGNLLPIARVQGVQGVAHCKGYKGIIIYMPLGSKAV